MTDKEKEDEKFAIVNKPDGKKKTVLFITDVTQYNHDTHEHPIEKALVDFESVCGKDFNIYVQARYKIDQRTIKSPSIRKMIVEIFPGDVVPALKAIHEKFPKVIENPDHVMTMSGPMRKAGYYGLIEKLCITKSPESLETLADKWKFDVVYERQVKEDEAKAKKLEEKKKKAADKAAAKVAAGND